MNLTRRRGLAPEGTPNLRQLPEIVHSTKSQTSHRQALKRAKTYRGPRPCCGYSSASSCLWIVRAGRSCLLGHAVSVEHHRLALLQTPTGLKPRRRNSYLQLFNSTTREGILQSASLRSVRRNQSRCDSSDSSNAGQQSQLLKTRPHC